MTRIYFASQNITSYPLKGKRKTLVKLLKKIFHDYKIENFEVTIIFTDNTFIRKLNKKFLKKTYNTDVITFNYNEKNDKNVFADIYISVEQVKDNAKYYGCPYECELLRVIIHGILHSLGFKDYSIKEKKEMTFLEDHYLNLFYSLKQC